MKSLNEFLVPGPNLNPNLLVMILKFQTYEVFFFFFASDIEKAYLMIEIAKEVGKYLKFLYLIMVTLNLSMY